MSVKILIIVSAQPCLVQNLFMKPLEVRGRCKQDKLQLRSFDVNVIFFKLALLFAM